MVVPDMGVGIVVPDPYPFAFRTRGGEVDIVRQINECAVGTHSFDLIPKQVLDRVVKQYFRFFDHQQFVGTGTAAVKNLCLSKVMNWHACNR